jgi:tetratricopeptide (TPR) repeat protein
MSVRRSFVTVSMMALLAAVLASRLEAAPGGVINLGIAGFYVGGSLRVDENRLPVDSYFGKNLRDIEGLTVIEKRQLEDKIGREIKFQQSGLVNEATAVEAGKITGCNYMLLGEVIPTDQFSADPYESESVYRDKKGNIIGRSITREIHETHDMSVNITARIVSVETGEVVWSGSELSDSRISKTYPKEGYNSNLSNSTVVSAAAQLSEESAYYLSFKLRREFAGQDIYVIKQSGSNFIIDAGTNYGIKNGDVFLVYGEGEAMRSHSGKDLGPDPTIIAALKVVNVQGAYSVCLVAKPSVAAAMRVGDRVEPIRFKRSSKLHYPKKRPPGLEESPGRSKRSDELLDALKGDGQPTPAQPVPPVPYQPPFDDEPIRPPAPAPVPVPPKTADEFDPNQSTDARVIDTYRHLSPTDRNTLGIQHRGAWNVYSKKRYKEAFEIFTKLADSYQGNYISAYWAGVCAMNLNSGKEAGKWFDRAIRINPYYKPAIDAKAKLGKAPANKKPGKKKK